MSLEGSKIDSLEVTRFTAPLTSPIDDFTETWPAKLGSDLFPGNGSIVDFF